MLLHQLKYPIDVEKRIRQQARVAGDVLPPDLVSPPRLAEDLAVYFAAFYELSTDRQITMGGVGAISWTSIMTFATIYDFNSEIRDELLYFIRSMDNAYLKHVGS